MPPSHPLFVAAVGDAHDPNTWSGIPYHLTEAGKEAGFVTAGLPLAAGGPRWTVRRTVWNALRILSGDRRGGYQYSLDFLERLWAPFISQIEGGTVINCFQLYPPSLVNNDRVRKWSFLDLSLTQLFDYYLLREGVGRRIAEEALSRERETYRRLEGIVAMSHFAAEGFQRDYGVDASRIHVVVPGANIDRVMYRDWEQNETRRRAAGPTREPLRLVMVTTDWRRKGLDRLLRALAEGRRRGVRATLRVVGARKEDLPPALTAVTGVEWVGRISKRTDAGRFFRAVCDADVGCIFPTYEAGGSVLREYHALGLAAFATTAGGMPDFMFKDAAVTVAPDATDDQLVAKLMEMEANRPALDELRATAWRRRHEALWSESVRQLRAIIDPQQP